MPSDPFTEAFTRGQQTAKEAEQASPAKLNAIHEKLKSIGVAYQRKIYDVLTASPNSFWASPNVSGEKIEEELGNPQYSALVAYSSAGGAVFMVHIKIAAVQQAKGGDLTPMYYDRSEAVILLNRRQVEVVIPAHVTTDGDLNFDDDQFQKEVIEALEKVPSAPEREPSKS